jgi:hypothetical protein
VDLGRPRARRILARGFGSIKRGGDSPEGRQALERGGDPPEGHQALERGGDFVARRLALERGGSLPEGYHDRLFGGPLRLFRVVGLSLLWAATTRSVPCGLWVCLFSFYYFSKGVFSPVIRGPLRLVPDSSP